MKIQDAKIVMINGVPHYSAYDVALAIDWALMIHANTEVAQLDGSADDIMRNANEAHSIHEWIEAQRLKYEFGEDGDK